MLHKMRQRAKDEKGFTLIELLVVILIIGILAAIAIPSFLAQKSKANDASAKELVRTAQTTAETYATDNNGSYAGLTLTGLVGVEPTINSTIGNGNAYLNPNATSGSVVNGVTNVSASTYTVTATAVPTGDTFSITKNSDGTVSRLCQPASNSNKGGCPNGTTTTAGTW
jgi:type IV pilus assembly protein PilA